ncbi:uncharacterized protein BX663DRAFT_555723 [Cokeromyces recurvatus]|uniref:uncharacterized protein n=1 Tax=Cokeromyces recurvatus TaxID=90255 RepID=UPI0022205A05|nr:uncharacterized protein BX663DRAFT_555723 [Cokeromyces recurvatus]KAI7898510.1 hypothetical protein BX663DRAFT_555723 [Cokeromyces recurvatus]
MSNNAKHLNSFDPHSSSAEIAKKLQVPVAEEEEEEKQKTEDKDNNNEQTLEEEDGDENDAYSHEGSDDATDNSLKYILNNNEDELRSVISSDEAVPAYLKQFELFQMKAFKKAKTVGLFVNADLYQIL